MLERREKDITDLERRVSNSVLVGKVSQVDHAKARYRVKAGKFESDWLPFTSARAGETRTYDSLDVGEQVVIVSPSGDPSQGIIVGSIATQAKQAADKGNIHRTIYPDGTVVEYDHEAKAYKMDVAEGGSYALNIGGGASIHASGGAIKIKAPGAIDIESATLTHNGKDISYLHEHTGVEPGGANTGPVA
ncbi:phage baseplate assembly protein V [Mesorhizobium sp. CA14]|uniref:phage baseplate assembly protein V n=1 Tax=Mesorhizobium sp. CA14 TaxID=2876642 RepID=UPI001CCFE693|nr:phage baseplate assembly protein V [Mesorhizobium sp. CA14]MBZ9850116.1 phage baseplate assembly protein V [Mesorhizobium sp. CA14]